MWYKNECWRIFPNIELSFDDRKLKYVCLAWLKFVIEIPMGERY